MMFYVINTGLELFNIKHPKLPDWSWSINVTKFHAFRSYHNPRQLYDTGNFTQEHDNGMY